MSVIKLGALGGGGGGSRAWGIPPGNFTPNQKN